MEALQTAFRIGVHLPFGDEREERAVKLITEHFEYEYNGSTYSSVLKPAFVGTWKSSRGRKYRADVCLLHIDTLVSLQDLGSHSIEAKATAMIKSIISKIRSFYTMVGKTQKSFWVTFTELKISSSA